MYLKCASYFPAGQLRLTYDILSRDGHNCTAWVCHVRDLVLYSKMPLTGREPQVVDKSMVWLCKCLLLLLAAGTSCQSGWTNVKLLVWLILLILRGNIMVLMLKLYVLVVGITYVLWVQKSRLGNLWLSTATSLKILRGPHQITEPMYHSNFSIGIC